MGRLGRVALVLGLLAIGVARVSAEGESEPPLARASQLRREAWALRSQGRAAEAIPRALVALRLAETAQGPLGLDVADSLYLLGELLRATEDYKRARPYYERALAIREQVLEPTHPDIAESVRGCGKIMLELGDFVAARALYEKALALREEELGQTDVRVAASLDDLGTLFMLIANYASARQLFERALAIRERALGSTDPAVANSLNDLAGLRQTMGDYTGARPLYERALKIREQQLGPESPQVSQTLNDLAGLLRTIGEYAAARSMYERALTIRTRLWGQSSTKVADTQNDLGTLLRTTGDNVGARIMYERALAIREKARDPMHVQVAESLNRLAGLLQAIGDFAAARPLYERALAIREQKFGPMHPAVAESLNSLAGLYRAEKNDAAAQPLYERALAIREQSLGPKHRRVASSLVNLAAVLAATGDDQRARQLYARALDIARATHALAPNWRAALGLGRIEEKAGRLDATLLLYREAVRIVGQLSAQFKDESRSRFLEAGNKLEAYDALASALLRAHLQKPDQGYDREAWATLEAKRSWVAADALLGLDRQTLDRSVREKAEPVLTKQDQVAALESQLEAERAKLSSERVDERVENLTRLLARTKAEFNDESKQFLQDYPQYKKLVADQRAIVPEDLAKYANRLPAGTIAVQFYSAPEALYTFVVGARGLYEVKKQTITQTELYALIWAYRRHMERGVSEPLPWEDDGSDLYRREVVPFKAVARRLGHVLLDPLRAELETNGDVVLFPNDLLMYLPIHALIWQGSAGPLRFFAETHRVRYATQHELPDVVMVDGSPAAVALVAVGNPDGTLPASSGEVRALGRLRAGAVVLEGAGATKNRLIDELKNQTGEFELHLATHGVLDGNEPDLSYLVMAGTDEASRRLTLKEVAGLTLTLRLAVLSACETAIPGEVAPGVALITLAKAFSTAGAQAVVAALWRVEEEATRDWMVALYRSLAAGESRVSAVQAAQTAVRSRVRTAHPYYWAAFILIGAR